MAHYTFRMAGAADVPAILRIYRTYVEETAITFETEVPSAEEFTVRVKSIAAQYPYIVCVSENRVVGYAYAHRHMERAAYQWNAELSVYVGEGHQRFGIGKRLYGILMDLLSLQNIKNVYGGVTSPGEKSEKLHESFGFQKLGTYHQAGYKCGEWHDVAWFEKNIGAYDLEPAPFLPVRQVDAGTISGILDSYAFSM